MEDVQPLQGPCSYGRCPNLPIVAAPMQVIFFSDICVHTSLKCRQSSALIKKNTTPSLNPEEMQTPRCCPVPLVILEICFQRTKGLFLYFVLISGNHSIVIFIFVKDNWASEMTDPLSLLLTLICIPLGDGTVKAV